jgi:hypothetical protein
MNNNSEKEEKIIQEKNNKEIIRSNKFKPIDEDDECFTSLELINKLILLNIELPNEGKSMKREELYKIYKDSLKDSKKKYILDIMNSAKKKQLEFHSINDFSDEISNSYSYCNSDSESESKSKCKSYSKNEYKNKEFLENKKQCQIYKNKDQINNIEKEKEEFLNENFNEDKSTKFTDEHGDKDIEGNGKGYKNGYLNGNENRVYNDSYNNNNNNNNNSNYTEPRNNNFKQKNLIHNNYSKRKSSKTPEEIRRFKENYNINKKFIFEEENFLSINKNKEISENLKRPIKLLEKVKNINNIKTNNNNNNDKKKDEYEYDRENNYEENEKENENEEDGNLFYNKLPNIFSSWDYITNILKDNFFNKPSNKKNNFNDTVINEGGNYGFVRHNREKNYNEEIDKDKFKNYENNKDKEKDKFKHFDKEKNNNKDNGNIIINAKKVGSQDIKIDNNNNNGKSCIIF